MRSDKYQQLSLLSDCPRSTLFRLDPIGMGTPYVESCSSFIARLAIAHCITVGILLTDVIAGTMGKESLAAYLARGGSRFYTRPATFHGQGQTTTAIVAALETLTCRNDLLYLTLLPWREFFDVRGMFREFRAWCPKCLESRKEESQEIYEPLIWALSLITICPVHFCDLAEACPECKRMSHALSPAYRPGYCPRCHAWLGRHVGQEKTLQKLTEFQRWSIDNVKFLLAAAPTLHFSPSRRFVNDAIGKFIKQKYSSSAGAFSKTFGFEKGTVNRWRSDQVLPTLKNLLKISFLSKTPLSDLLSRGVFIEKADYTVKDTSFFSDRTSKVDKYFDRNEVNRYLRKILSGRQSRPPTVTEVARILGYSKKTIYKYFPKQCTLVAAAAKSARSINKTNLIEQDSLFVRNAIEQLCLEGMYPSYDRVEALSPKKGILRRKEVRKTWRDSMKEMSFWDEI